MTLQAFETALAVLGCKMLYWQAAGLIEVWANDPKGAWDCIWVARIEGCSYEDITEARYNSEAYCAGPAREDLNLDWEQVLAAVVSNLPGQSPKK